MNRHIVNNFSICTNHIPLERFHQISFERMKLIISIVQHSAFVKRIMKRVKNRVQRRFLKG